MSEPIDFVEIPSVDFGRWLLLQHVPVPASLDSASFTQVTLEDHEWEAVVRRPDVGVANVATQRDVTGFAPRIAEVLLRLAHIFDAPELSLYMVRRTDASLTISAGISRGRDAVLVVDDGSRTRLASVAPTNMAAPLAALQPRLTPGRFKTASLSSRELQEIEKAGPARRTTTEASVLARHGLSDDDLTELAEIRDASSAHGIVGAMSHAGSDMNPSPIGGDWVEAPRGTLVKLLGRDGSLTLQPADRSVLTRMASASLAAAR